MYDIIGIALILIGGGIGYAISAWGDVVYYGWFAQWLPQQVRERVQDRKTFSAMLKEFNRNYFTTGLTKDADPIFQPYLSVLGPSAIAMTAFLVAGLLIMGLQSLTDTLLILLVLTIIVPGCVLLAIWQLGIDVGRRVLLPVLGNSSGSAVSASAVFSTAQAFPSRRSVLHPSLP